MPCNTGVFPDYRGGSIVNLMASILQSFGARSMYQPLKQLSAEELKRAKNVVLIVVDGMGFEFLRDHGAGTILHKNVRSSMTSVFPATTATAITTFNTGLAPQEHAITGWFVYLKELGVATTILPFNPRCGGNSFGKGIIDPRVIFNKKPVFDQVGVKSFVITLNELVDSDYTRAMSGRATRIGYDSLQGFFDSIVSVMASSKERKYIHAYWSKLDSLCHKYGTRGIEVLSHFKDLADHFARFSGSIGGKDAIVIITADHGLMDTDARHTITVNKHDDLLQTLTLPVCGEPRVAYCYVHPGRTTRFERYVERRFKDACSLHRSETLIKKHYFGLNEPAENLLDRIGDYILIMKENYVLRHFVLGEPEYYLVGNHGGMSTSEMLVPLIVLAG